QDPCILEETAPKQDLLLIATRKSALWKVDVARPYPEPCGHCGCVVSFLAQSEESACALPAVQRGHRHVLKDRHVLERSLHLTIAGQVGHPLLGREPALA